MDKSKSKRRDAKKEPQSFISAALAMLSALGVEARILHDDGPSSTVFVQEQALGEWHFTEDGKEYLRRLFPSIVERRKAGRTRGK